MEWNKYSVKCVIKKEKIFNLGYESGFGLIPLHIHSDAFPQAYRHFYYLSTLGPSASINGLRDFYQAHVNTNPLSG